MEQYNDYVTNLKDELAPIRKELRETSALLKQLRERANSLRIVVAGGFSSGKSAFINKLVGADVAVEGAKATTRCSTEYFHSETRRWLNIYNKEIPEAEYRRLSSEEGSKQRFRVGLPCEFLKGGTLVIDTPGFGNVKDDDDNAKTEVRNCDILFWLVNAKGGTILDSELTALVNATKIDGAQKPLAVFLTQIDLVDGKDALEHVKKKVAEQLREKSLRLVHPPLTVSIKDDPDDFPPSLRPYIAGQRQEIEKIVNECKQKGAILSRNRELRLEDRCKVLAVRIAEKCNAARDYLLAQRWDVEKGIRDAAKEQERRFWKDVAYIVESHVTGITVYNSNDAIVSYKDKEGLIWDDYTAYFKPSSKFLEPQALDAKIGHILAKYSDYNDAPLDCSAVHQTILNEIWPRVHSATCDSCGDNETDARMIVAARVRIALSEFSFKSVRNEFIRLLKLPNVEWKCPNIDSMHDELDEISASLARIKSLRQYN